MKKVKQAVIDELQVKPIMHKQIDEFFDTVLELLGVPEQPLPPEWHNRYDATLETMEDLVNEWLEHQLEE